MLLQELLKLLEKAPQRNDIYQAKRKAVLVANDGTKHRCLVNDQVMITDISAQMTGNGPTRFIEFHTYVAPNIGNKPFELTEPDFLDLFEEVVAKKNDSEWDHKVPGEDDGFQDDGIPRIHNKKRGVRPQLGAEVHRDSSKDDGIDFMKHVRDMAKATGRTFEEVLNESITFGVAELDMSDPKYPEGIFSGAKWWRKEEEDCWVCDGKGTEEFGDYEHEGKYIPASKETCRYCNGKKKIDAHKSDSPEMNLSNHNALELLAFLGIAGDDDYAGHIAPKDFPEIRRKLIKMKNGGADDFITPNQHDDFRRTVKTKDENGLDKIERRGVQMHTMGRTPQQVMRYVDTFLEILDFAQKHDAYVTWA